MITEPSQPDALPDADADDGAIEQTGPSDAPPDAQPDDLSVQTDGRDAGVTASGAE